MTEQLDKNDISVLVALEENARRPITVLAKRLRMNKDTVRYRIERLEERGIIEGYYAELNTQLLGYTAYRVYIKTQNLPPKRRAELFAWLAANANTFFVIEIIGPWDLAFLLWARTNDVFERFWTTFREAFKENIQEHRLSIFTHLHIFPRKYLGVPPARLLVTPGILPTIDDVDKRILKVVANNPRVTSVELAAKLKTSARVVAYRIKQLERSGIILRYRPKINYSLLGKQYFKVDINLNDITKLRALHEYAYNHPNIMYINQTIGYTDFEFDVEADSFEAFIAIISDLQTKFPGAIRDYSYFQITRMHKISYFPQMLLDEK